MPRPLRDQSAGIRHVTCRGNRGQAIFLDDDDRLAYLRLLGTVCRALGWRVPAWCLMTNHVHLVVSVTGGTISRGMQWLSGDHAQGFNRRHGYTGHLFQGRFRAEHVEDERYFYEVVRYVDLNPERAGMETAHRWRWSGHRAQTGLELPLEFHDVSWVQRFGTGAHAFAGYGKYVDEGRYLPRPLPPRRRPLQPWREGPGPGSDPGPGRNGQ